MRNRNRLLLAISLTCTLLVIACSEAKRGDNAARRKSSIDDMYLDEPSVALPTTVTVQHCLISFKGASKDMTLRRTKEEAKKLAEEVFAKAKAGEDFDKIVEQYTNDSPPGIYKMVNFGLVGDQSEDKDPSEWIFDRGSMAAAFGDVSFDLEVGEIGMAEYHRDRSPFGYHIIKRLK